MKLKGLIHDFILGISIFSVCVCYFLIGAPTPIKAMSSASFAQRALAIVYKKLLTYPDFNSDDYKYFMVHYITNNDVSDNIFVSVAFIPTTSKVEPQSLEDGKFTRYWVYETEGHKILYTSLTYEKKSGDFSANFEINKKSAYAGESGIDGSGNNTYLYGIFNLQDDTRFDNTVQPDYCTFTYLTDHEKLSDLLVEINTTPEAKQTVTVTTERGSALTCTDKSTNKVYSVGEYPIINGVPSFASGLPKCKDEQIPTDDNNYFFQMDVPKEDNAEYHAVCEYDNQKVYEYIKGSTGGGVDPNDPDYGIFTPLIELLKGLGYWFIELIKAMFQILFAPSENFLSDKFNEIYNSFGYKFPFISQIKPIADSVINLFNSSSTSPPDLTITLPDLFGGSQQTIIDLNLFSEYRTLIHGMILFIFCTNYLFDLPRKVSSALGEDK